MIKAHTRYKLQEVFFIIIYWIAVCNLYILIRYIGSPTNPSPGAVEEVISIHNLILMSSLGGLFLGAIIGLLEIFLYPLFLRKKSFGSNILYRTIIFVLVIILVTASLSVIFYTGRGYSILQTARLTLDYYLSTSFISVFLYMLIASSVMDFILQVNKKFGPGVIYNMLQGKYYHPREEERIFMFLDLQSSTQIAETLGHINFSYLLQDCYRDLSDVLMKYEASVYQFVGDEAVLTWQTKSGLKDSNCLNLFFEFERLLMKRKPYYLSKYNHSPIFKAAVNMGKVTVAEVGEIKSEIAYHGDVLNTAARVQGLCNTYNQRILVTQAMVDGLSDCTFHFEFIDEVDLRGKRITEKIFKVNTN